MCIYLFFLIVFFSVSNILFVRPKKVLLVNNILHKNKKGFMKKEPLKSCKSNCLLKGYIIVLIKRFSKTFDNVKTVYE